MTTMACLPQTLNVPSRTLSGAGQARSLAGEVAPYGKRVLLVHGRSCVGTDYFGDILAGFSGASSVTTYCHEGGEPTLGQLNAFLLRAREVRPDCVVAIGGGSVMDLAKAGAGLLHAPLSVEAYHRGAELPPSVVPFVAVPTTAGTGSEATYVSVLSDTEQGVKKSIRDPSHLPRLVILDPLFLRNCPAQVLAASGMDAFTQAVESYVSRGATGWSDALALHAAKRVIENLLHVAANRDADDDAYLALLQGSYLAGLALSHARLGLVHGLAHPLGYRYHAAHGLVCGVCLPAVIRFNREVAAGKFDQLSAHLGQDILDVTESSLQRLGIVSPFAGVDLGDEDAIVRETLESGSTRANPRDVNGDDVRRLLSEIFAPHP